VALWVKVFITLRAAALQASDWLALLYG